MRSTTYALNKYVRNILDTLNARKYAVGLLLDTSKAYDRGDYGILLNKRTIRIASNRGGG